MSHSKLLKSLVGNDSHTDKTKKERHEEEKDNLAPQAACWKSFPMKFPGWEPPDAAKTRLRKDLIAFCNKSPDNLNTLQVASKCNHKNNVAGDSHGPSTFLAV
jgi:hypothetical protein